MCWRSARSTISLFGIAILVFTRPAAAILGLARSRTIRVYLQLNGVFFLILGAVYLAASRDPGRYPAVAPISAAGRVLGFVLFAWAWRGGRPSTFLALGLGGSRPRGRDVLPRGVGHALSD